MKEILTFLLILALLEISPVFARPDPPPPAAAACIVAVIGIGCVSFMVYGLYRMCQAIPAPETEPPAWAPLSEIPGMGPPSYIRPLPHLKLNTQLYTSRVSLQHSDGPRAGWQTDYTFVATQSQIGGLAMVVYDSNGVPLLTNDVPIVTYGGENYAGFNFTNLPPAMTDNASCRMFRLLSQ